MLVTNFFTATGNRIGDVGAKALANALKSNASVTNIDLSCKKTLNFVSASRTRRADCVVCLANRIGDEGVTALADALEVNTAVLMMGVGGEKVARGAR